MATSDSLGKGVGLAYWMLEVLQQSDKAAADFSSDVVHDLRTALRRCRSMADGMMVFDADPGWKKMKRSGKQLFSSLGELRDTHVIGGWIDKLVPEDDPARKTVVGLLFAREQESRKIAAAALDRFDRKQWRSWAEELPKRAARISADSPAFAHLALERWHDARALHRQALRNRTNIAFHRLRIALKRFRYTVENFLPRRREVWEEDLKHLQDLLGDMHDLDVLWQTAVRSRAFPDAATRARWRARVEQERRQHLRLYREKMAGRNSLWRVWRAGLPRPEELRSLALQRLRIWASFLDPDIAHAQHIARLALELYDGLPGDGILTSAKRETYRYILQAAASMHDVGRSRTNKGHHKASARLIRKLGVPLGWTAPDLHTAALVARYHRGALPKSQRRFRTLPSSRQRAVELLGGVLRFACACDRQHDRRIRQIEIETSSPVLTIRAQGYTEYTALAEHLAAARHLLELACHRPVVILPLAAKN